MHLTFDTDHIVALLKASIESKTRLASPAQMADPAMWRSDMEPGRLEVLQAEITEYGLPLSIKLEEVNTDLVGPGLWLIGDIGIYIMSNIPADELRAGGLNHVAYAQESDPSKVSRDEWVRVKHQAFGMDDGIEFLEGKKVAAGLQEGVPYKIFVSPYAMALPVAPIGRRVSLDAAVPGEPEAAF